MSIETFYAPSQLGDACSLLSSLGENGIIIAGGTDLMVRFNRHRRKRKEVLVYVGNLGLDFIKESDGQMVIGACTTVADIASSPLVRKDLPLLARACGEMASPAVRNAATLGGNLVTNARNADGVAALMALGAEVVIASTAGETRMPVEQFVSTPKIQKLANGGIVKHFEVPCLTPDDKWAWEKLRQRQGDSRSILSVSLRARMQGNVCRTVRLVLGGMAANPFVAKTPARLLEGRSPSAELVDQVTEEILAETDAATDARATAWYRERAAQVLVKRVLNQIA